MIETYILLKGEVMIFIGIDLAWTYKNETGICILSDEGDVLNLSSDHLFR